MLVLGRLMTRQVDGTEGVVDSLPLPSPDNAAPLPPVTLPNDDDGEH